MTNLEAINQAIRAVKNELQKADARVEFIDGIWYGLSDYAVLANTLDDLEHCLEGGLISNDQTYRPVTPALLKREVPATAQLLDKEVPVRVIQ